MLQRYLTVRPEGETEIEINRSRFISYVKRVETQEEAVAFIQEIKKKHWDATHNCSAYIVGENDQFQKMDDDGEPSGTAGKPILEVIKKKGLKDTAIVVTRYFGGIKLGAGGLIRAYGKSASAGVRAAGVVERILTREHHFSFDYTFLGKVENELNAQGYQIVGIQYLDKVTVTVGEEEGLEEPLKQLMTNLTSGQAEWTGGDLVYIEREQETGIDEDE
ncbi:YigZ family protein [Aneurinibacillus aneurinilyticus]|uniref:YigZ family protein n=1 Tax=Aneurinibacillus aneurinilyticus TaxID=1391 RepID=A0A848CVP3_ANEAE|nr:YigZ family protein [Aneurinibacillus aneurinilyticus]MCI1694538.1 YigZ family protein [Aneurinibacillus aneurinilyticus]MED0670903.1 YigZ family protein [Aneurinibacillus aneurinilyticus]MED0705613.1 YigZ family protein [Aneurinibacillus aneurinilyticus]MED0724504.1 YigZ family protein [Aneurinibacillus aneurinilyticus]MED0731339.1 YigZ family protein [Aneurinibacillus aneurinilyticus]